MARKTIRKDKKYKLLLTHNQLRVIERALDLYGRVGIGQLETVIDHLEYLFPRHPNLGWDAKEKYSDPMKKGIFGFGGGASFGIPSKDVSDDAKISYDIEKVIQKKIATVEGHDRSSVWHNGPMLHLGSEPIAEIEDWDLKKEKE